MSLHQSGTDANECLTAEALPITILLVDDLDETRSITKLFLGAFGYVVHSLPRAADALALFDPGIHDLVVTGNAMPGMTGVEMAHVIKMRSPSTPILMYADQGPEDRSCLDAVIEKPATLPVLKGVVDRLLALRA